MHLIWENLIPNLVSLWTGKFKGLDAGSEDYEFSGTVWDAIGEATAKAGDTLPSIFGPRLGNISKDRSSCTADAWSLWTLYIAPVLLRSRFKHVRYYNHFVSLVELLNTCLQFELTKDDIKHVREGFIQWVQKYEKYYYQYSNARLATCPVTIHSLLHIADGIEAAGPVWASWAFPMERFCGNLQPAIKSRRYPWASIDNRILVLAQLTQVGLKYDMQQELRLRPLVTEGTTHGELFDTDCELFGIVLHTLADFCSFRLDPTCVLMPPHQKVVVEKGLRDKIIGALATRFDIRVPTVRSHIPQQLDQWGKVRILNEGDTAHAAALVRRTEDHRDRTFVRYEVFVDKHARNRKRKPEYELQTFFGRLERIFSIRIEADAALRALHLDAPTTIFLAAIKSCAIQSSHPRLDIHYYSAYGALTVVDIQCIQCVVGRVQDVSSRGWGIVDRSGALSRALADAENIG
ncbi:hypothetical protein C8Q70DRAFT_1045373 [Cubamyces menziesii]|nr:hypothetical protein C8Q70DRAFT_1045373 [Cubamyces menziesii]